MPSAGPEGHYERLSVNRGQGEYQEWFIKGPFNVPGTHDEFNAPNLFGWFRVRAYGENGTVEIQEIQSELFQKNRGGFSSEDPIGDAYRLGAAAQENDREKRRKVSVFIAWMKPPVKLLIYPVRY